MFEGYLALTGVELVNSCRASAYSPLVSCCCQGLAAALGHPSYLSPALDNAPWFDPGVPESNDFHGVAGLEFIGSGTGTGRRTVIESARGGAVLSNLRQSHREIAVRAIMAAATDAGLAYGAAWLSAALEGSDRCGSNQTSGCAYDAIHLFSSCPGCTVPSNVPWPPPDCVKASRLTLFGAGVLADVATVEERQSSGGWLREVEFTLAAGQPFMHREAIVVVDNAAGFAPAGRALLRSLSQDDRTPLPTPAPPRVVAVGTALAIAIKPIVLNPCPESVGDCNEDPLCLAPFPPPPVPVPVDPCQVIVPQDPHVMIVTVPAGTVPRWLAMVPILRIVTDTSVAMRRVIVRVYQIREDAGEVECTQALLDDCNVVAEFGVPYVREGSTLYLDGRAESGYVVCPDGRIQAITVYTSAGPIGRWPSFSCASSWCVALMVEAASVTDQVQISVSVAAREKAA